MSLMLNNADQKTSASSSIKETKRYHCDHPGCTKKYSQKFRLQIHKRTHVYNFLIT